MRGLPAGLNYDAGARTISGQPENAGNTRVTAIYTDRAGNQTSKTFEIQIAMLDAEKSNNAPAAKVPIQSVFWGENVNPEDSVTTNGLTDNPQYSWKTDATPNPQQAGQQTAKVVVTYADASFDEVEVRVEIKPLSEKYTPVGRTITVAQGAVLGAEQAESAVDQTQLAQVKSYVWDRLPSTAHFANQLDGRVQVVYVDDSSDLVDVKVKVLSDIIPAGAIAQKPTDFVQVDFVSDADKGVVQGERTYYLRPGVQVQIPAPQIQPKRGYVFVDWSVDLQGEFRQDTSIIANYTMTKAQKQDKNLKLSQELPLVEEFISNKDAVPAGTQFAWKGGDAPVKDIHSLAPISKTIVVTYPGNLSEELQVTMSFEDDIKPSLQAIADLTATKNEAITEIAVLASDNIGVDRIEVQGLPDGLRFDESSKNILGTISKDAPVQSYVIRVNVSDAAGNQVFQTFSLGVQSQADKYIPTAQLQTVEVKTSASPKASIANVATLPVGTQFDWEREPDVMSPKELVTAVVKVTYPDGSSETLDVELKVQDTQNPVIRIEKSFSADVAQSHSIKVSASDNDQVASLQYGYADAQNACASVNNYIPLQAGGATALTDVSQNGKWVCIKAVDRVGNTAFEVL